MSKKKDVKK